MLPRIAVGVCVLGLVGLLLPFVSSPLGLGFSLFSLSPGFAVLLLLLFLGITTLPVLDVRARTMRFTPWLAIPGGVGTLTGFVVLAVFSGSSTSDSLAGLAISSGLVTLGSGAILMLIAAMGLAVVGVYAFVLERQAAGPWSGPHPGPGTRW